MTYCVGGGGVEEEVRRDRDIGERLRKQDGLTSPRGLSVSHRLQMKEEED